MSSVFEWSSYCRVQTPDREHIRQSQALRVIPSDGVQRREQRPAQKLKHGEKIVKRKKTHFRCAGSDSLTQVARRGGGTPTLEGTPASAAPALCHRPGPTPLRRGSGTGRPPAVSAGPPRACPACPAALPSPRPAGVPRSAPPRTALSPPTPARPRRGRCCGSACSPRTVSGAGDASRPPGTRLGAAPGVAAAPGPGAP